MEATQTNTKIKFIFTLNNSREYTEDIKLININENENKNINIRFISFDDIIISFQNFLKDVQYNCNSSNKIKELPDLDLNNIVYEYIRYYNGKSWIILHKNQFIFINKKLTLENLKIKTKVFILKKENIYINNQLNNINKEINNINFELNNIKKNSHKTPFNLIVLIANPLMDGKKELRTMNDFNILPANLYYLLNEQDYLKYVDFQPLTKKAFKEIIENEEKRPDILHLICKSIYKDPDKNTSKNENEIENQKMDYNDNNDSSNFINLIFEKDDYNAEFITKKDIKEIFSESKESAKNMTLIISTQLAEDVYNMFQFDDFKFANILVQHTTLANIDFVTKFNLLFYQELISFQLSKINDIYNDAINIYFNNKYNTFCCCFHKHKNCDFIKNELNELYNINNCINDIKKLKEIIPHFCHLKPKCHESLDPPCKKDDFCLHKNACLKRLKLYLKDTETEKDINFDINICCCKKDNIIHTINNIFSYNFSNKKNFDNNNKLKIYLKDNYIPKYEKMEFLVGKNQIVFNAIEFINSNDIYYNIYGVSIENLKIFGNIIIEYYKERYHLYESEKKEKKDIKEFESIDLYDDNKNNFQDEFGINKINKIYFIYDYLKDNELTNLIDKEKTKLYKIIWFSEKQINSNKIDRNQKIDPDPQIKNEKQYKEITEHIPNEYIKYQHDYTVRNIWIEKKKKNFYN